MEAVTYTCKGVRYEILPITDTEDIELDIEEVSYLIEDENVDMGIYRAAMVEAVEQGLAFRVVKDGTRCGFVYSYVEEYRYIGASINLPGDMVSVLLGLKTIFDIQDSHKILILPHDKGLKSFVSMATGKSIRAYHSVGMPLTILRSSIVEKGKKMFKYLGVENG